MSDDEKLDAKLRAFLDADARARAQGITLEALYKVVMDIASDRLIDRKLAMKDREAAAEDRRAVASLSEVVGRYVRRTHAIERQLQTVSERPEVPDWRPDPREITGTHQLKEIQAAAVRAARVDEMHASREWWREHLWMAVGALLLATITGCAGYVLSRVTVTPASIPVAHP